MHATSTKRSRCPVIFCYRLDSLTLFSRIVGNLEIRSDSRDSLGFSIIVADLEQRLESRDSLKSRESAFAYISTRLWTRFPARRTRYGSRPVPYGPAAVPAVAAQPYRYGPRPVPRSLWPSRRTPRLMGAQPYPCPRPLPETGDAAYRSKLMSVPPYRSAYGLRPVLCG